VVKKLTMDDIARLAGVSKATVSRIIHSPHLVRPEKRDRIRRIMESNHYVYDAIAGDLSRKRSSVIGLIIPTIKSSIFASSTHGVQEHAKEHGYSIIIGNTNYNPESEVELVRLLQQRRVAGLILTGITRGVKELVNRLTRAGIPCVATWETVDDPGINYVGFDNFKAARAMTEYLIRLKHRRIGLIIGPYQRVERVRLRLEGYRKALEAYGIPFDPSLVMERGYTLVEGKEAMGHLLSLANRPTAVFAASDVLAMGALAAARDRGLSVPGNVSIAGFDDIDFAAYTDPPLTTVKVPAYEMGQLAMKVLLERIENDASQVRQYCLDTDLIIRGSCREPEEGNPWQV
jgi:DNA-binding LacI/PurR family transcriptional regulator